MKSRLDRYNEPKEKEQPSRLSKNKYLYDDLNNKIGFEEIVNFDTQTRIELTSINIADKNRENYQQLKDYRELINKDLNTNEEEVVFEEEEKNFDINSILENARKNRTVYDEELKKRKLNDEEYDVLMELNKKYLTKDSKTNKEKDDLEGLEDLINTITSKTLKEEVKAQEEQDLFGELVATNVDLQVKPPEEYENNDSGDIVTKVEFDNDEDEVDESFYTKSMDLSKEDFDFDDIKEEAMSKKRGLLIAFISILLIAIIIVVLYFVLQYFEIDLLSFFTGNTK